MNPIVKGITQIRNSILYSIYLSLSILALQLFGLLFKNIFFIVVTLLLALAALVLCIIFIVRLYSGIKILRKVNLIEKLNQRLDQAISYFNITIAVGIISFIVIIIGSVLLSPVTITVGMIISLLILVFSWLFMLRLIQVNGILGVYARNKSLVDTATSVKSLFYIQIGASVLSYAAMLLKTYMGLWYLAIMVPVWIFSIFFLIVFIGMLNKTIKLYSQAE